VESFIIPYASGAAIPPEAAAHFAECERCRRLALALSAQQDPAPPSKEQLKRIETAILADLTPVKPLAPAGLRFAMFLLAVLLVSAVGAAALGTAGWHALGLLQKLTVFVALAAGASGLAFSAGRQMIPGRSLLIPPYWLVAGVFAVLTVLVLGLFHPRPESTFVATGLVCLRIGLGYAAPAAFLFWLLLRRGAILDPPMTGATAGALAGLTGLTVLEIFSPNLNLFHILIWHFGAAFTSVAAGLAIGKFAVSSARKP
jgi:hypothetical protein